MCKVPATAIDIGMQKAVWCNVEVVLEQKEHMRTSNSTYASDFSKDEIVCSC